MHACMHVCFYSWILATLVNAASMLCLYPSTLLTFSQILSQNLSNRYEHERKLYSTLEKMHTTTSLDKVIDVAAAAMKLARKAYNSWQVFEGTAKRLTYT